MSKSVEENVRQSCGFSHRKDRTKLEYKNVIQKLMVSQFRSG